jgi:acyl-ACP thioesterase
MDLSLPFARPYRVRFDEAGADGRARPSALVRYLQDLAWQHSAAAGLDRAWYEDRGLGWLVRGLELELCGGAWYGETLDVTTRITGWRRMWCRRVTTVAGADGTPVAQAAIDWVLLDARGRPVRIPAELESFAPHVETFTPVRIDLPEAGPDVIRVASSVRASDVDPMGHLNNAAYVDLVAEVMAAAGWAVGPGWALRLEYLLPALPGMELELTAWPHGASLAIRIRELGGSADLLRARAERTA